MTYQKLPVPSKISLRWEAWQGFGAAEIPKTILCTALFAALSTAFIVAVWHFKVLTVAALSIVFWTTFFCGFFSRAVNNQSIYDFLANLWRFRHSQQHFLYHRRKERVYLVQEEKRR